MFSHSISGIRNSINLMEKAAADIARGSQADIIKSQVNMIIAENSLSANIAAIKTADQMQKTIIDIIA